MARQKKIKNIDLEEKTEVYMSQVQASNVSTLDELETEVDRVRQELEATKRELEEKKSEVKSLPMREVDADEMVIVKKQHAVSVKNAALKEKIEKQKAYDSLMVTGKFINRRAPGQPAKLTYIKYQDDPVKWYIFEDGKVYTIPRGFADQLNGGTDNDPCYYTPHFIQKQGEMDPNRPSSTIHDVDTSNKKYAFVPVTF